MYRVTVTFVLVLAIPAWGFDGGYVIDTAAGSGWVGDQGPARAAILRQAEGLSADINGNIYVADAGGHRIRQIDPQGVIRTIAGTGVRGYSGDGGAATQAQLDSPYGILRDIRGNLYIADLGNRRVRRVGIDGTITTVAGGGSIPAGGENDGSVATALALGTPRNLAMDRAGNLYISDFSGQRVYRLDNLGVLTTFTGTGEPGYSGDGTAASRAQVAYPAALAVDQADAVYIGDSQNHVIRKVTKGVMSTFARAPAPTGLTFDALGTLYVADASGGQILQIPLSGKSFGLPLAGHDLAVGMDANLYVSDGAAVRRVTPLGVVTTAAGGGDLAHGDQGNAKQALLNHSSGVAVDASGNLLIADRDNHRIRRVTTSGIITTIAGTGDAGDSGDGGLATQATLNSPSAVSVDSAGVVYVVDSGNHRIRKITTDGKILAVITMKDPNYAIPDSTGGLYISDPGQFAIFRYSAGRLTTFLDGLKGPRGLALDNQGNLYFTEMDAQRVTRVAPDGSMTRLASGLWNIPRGVAISSIGDVLVADTGLQQVIRIDPAGKARIVAGTGQPGFSGDGGPAVSAQLGFPYDIATGPNGATYVAEVENSRIRVLTPAPDNIISATPLLEVVNAASQQPGPLAPGMLVTITGENLSGATQVMFGSLAGRILSTTDSRLIVQVPPEPLPTLIDVNVRSESASLGTIRAVAVVPAAPTLSADAAGQIAATNEDGSVNTSANPAPRGSIVSVYGTGFGVGTDPITVRISGLLADVLYAGPLADYPGLVQFNIRIPAEYLPAGIVYPSISVGQVSTQTGLTIAIQ